jgi:predicted phosphohydrolase
MCGETSAGKIRQMRIALLSDIHAEFYKDQPDWLPPLPDNIDVLVLAGDIAIGKALTDVVERISTSLPDTEIVLVAGNHEFYRQPRQQTLDYYRQSFAAHKRIHFLENDYVDIGELRFVGATLWTGFALHDQNDDRNYIKAMIQASVSDFRLIREDGFIDRVFSPVHAEKLFHQSCNAIGDILQNSDPQNTIVVTHFPPMPDLHHPGFPLDWLSSYFTADCSELVNRYQPAYWFYGHNHWSHQQKIGATQFISNQYGYPNEVWQSQCNFNQELIIEMTP